MEGKVFPTALLVAAIVKFQFDQSKPFPVAINDVVIWDRNPMFDLRDFQEWMDLYFEYVITDHQFRITGILTKNLLR